MPRPYLRSRTVKRTEVHTPGGTTIMHYRRARKGLPRCAECGATLGGIGPLSMTLPKSARRVSRVFGGRLCHNCTASRFRALARGASA